MNKESEKYWKVLKGETTMPEALSIIFGYTNEGAVKMVEIMTNTDLFSYHGILSSAAYIKLVELGEIADDKIFYPSDNPQYGDVGFKGNKMYVYRGDGNSELIVC